MKLSQLKPLEKNPFKSKGDKQIAAIGKSISEFEKMMEIRKIVIDENNQILGGNKRFFALKALGRVDIPDSWVDQVTGLTEAEKREFIVKDNSHWGSEWDFELLKDWGVDLDDWGVQVDWEGPHPEASEDDYQIPDEIVTDIVVGDLFEIGVHRLICGDSTDKETVERLMGGEKANLCFTSPPYWVGKDYEYQNSEIEIDEFIEKILKNVITVTDINNSRIIINTGTGMATRVGESKSRVILLIDKYVNKLFSNDWYLRSIRHWIKGGGNGNGPISPKTDYVFSGMEYLLCFYNINGINRGQEKISEGFAQQSNWNDINGDKQENKAGYPVELPSRFIKLYSKINEIIFEPFGGNGTNWVAAHQLNRRCYGLELEPKYVEIIVRRMLKLDNTLKIIKNNIDVTEIFMNKLK